MSTKRILSLVLALVMVLGTFGTVFAAPTASEKAEFLLEQGILKELKLDQDLKRRDAVILLSRLLDVEEKAKNHQATDKYDDIDDAFYNGYIGWATLEGLFNGHENGKFLPNDSLQARQYATVLLRALGYQEDGKDIFDESYAIAKDLGILEGVEVEEKEAVTRADIAAMTYNALSVVVKGTGKTLAETLEIEMPVEEATELKVEKVYTENLKEVVVKVNNVKLLDEVNAKNVANYRLTLRKVDKVTIYPEANELVLSLNEEYKAGQRDTLVIRNMNSTNRALISSNAFVAADNVRPVVLSAEYLGKKGIKVTFSEPIKEAQERAFRLEGYGGNRNNVVMKVMSYGREVILNPYANEEFNMDLHEKLTVGAVADYNNLRSVSTELVVEKAHEGYEEAPVVVDVKAVGTRLIVEFDKEIYEPSVKAYAKSTDTGNVEYRVRGTHASFAKEATMLDPKTVAYDFERELSDRFTDVVISGVKNHEDVAMTTVTRPIEIVQERIEPIVIRTDVMYPGKDRAVVELEFDEAIVGNMDGGTIDFTKHFNLFLVGLGRFQDPVELVDTIDPNTQTYADGEVGITAEIKATRPNVVEIKLENLKTKIKDDKVSYILETERFESKATRVPMFREYTDIELLLETAKLKVVKENVIPYTSHSLDNRIGELRFTFNEKLDRDSAENANNYLFKDNFGKFYRLDDLNDAYAELDGSGYRVNLVFPNGLVKGSFEYVEIIKGIKALNGAKVLDETVRYSFVDGLMGLISAPGATIEKTADNEYLVTSVTNFTLKTDLEAKITVKNDLATGTIDLTINAPNADVVLDGDFGTVTVEAISPNTLILAESATIAKLEVKTSFEVKGKLGNAEIVNIADKAVTVTVGSQKVKLEEGQSKEVVDGKVEVLTVTITKAVYNNGSANVEFTVKDQDGDTKTDLEANAFEVKVNGKVVTTTVTAPTANAAGSFSVEAKVGDKIVVIDPMGNVSREYKVTKE